MKTILFFCVLCGLISQFTMAGAEKAKSRRKPGLDRRNKPKPRNRDPPSPCNFDKKSHGKKNSENSSSKKRNDLCRPFWTIRRPVCRNKRDKIPACNRKFCWKPADAKARSENELIPKGDFLLVQARWAKTGAHGRNDEAESNFISMPFRVSEKYNTKCFKFKHLMRAELPNKSKFTSSRKSRYGVSDSMQLKVNILTSDKKAWSKSWNVWSREDAVNGDQWIETELNLIQELGEIFKGKKRSRSRKKPTTYKKKIKIQFQALHAGASKTAFIAIDNLQFSNDCTTRNPTFNKNKRPKPSTPKQHDLQTPKKQNHDINNDINKELVIEEIYRAETDQFPAVRFKDKHAAAYRPEDDVIDLRYSHGLSQSPEPVREDYLNSGTIYSPNHADYYDYARFTDDYLGTDSMQACKYSNYAVDIGDCIKKFKNEMEVLTGYGTRKNLMCSDRYEDMVRCMKDCAFLCADMNGEESINSGSLDSGIDQILNNELHLKDSYCGDQTDVFPTFNVDRYGTDCSQDVRQGMTECALKLFNSSQGNLCRDFHRASECKRELLGKQCKFKSIENMLIFGVGIEVQNAYNPFCQKIHTNGH